MATFIHPSAVVDPAAKLGVDVSIGPFTVVEGNVEIGDGTKIVSHAIIANGTRMGKRCRIFTGAVIGTIPQDLKFAGEETILEIGDDCMIREYCTINRGTVAAGRTKIGNRCAILSYGHVGHDCIVGDGIIASNNLGLSGHVEVGNHVGFGGYAGVAQFVRIGDYSFIGGKSGLNMDVPPYALFSDANGGAPAIRDINKVGLERHGFDEDRRRKIKRAYKTLFRSGLTLTEGVNALDEEYKDDADIKLLTNFIRGSKKGVYGMNVD